MSSSSWAPLLRLAAAGMRRVGGASAVAGRRAANSQHGSSAGSQQPPDSRQKLIRLLPLAVASAGGTSLYESAGKDASGADSCEPVVLPEMPVIPDHIGMLTANDVSVPPHMLLRDLSWDSLLKSPLLSSDRELAEAVQNEMRQLEKWSQRGHNVDARTADRILKKFSTWWSLHEVKVTLDAGPEAQVAMRDVLQNLDSSYDDIQNRQQKVLQLQRAGLNEEAHSLAQRSIKAVDRLNSTLDQIRAQLEEAREEACERARNFLLKAGGFAIVGLACSYLGVAPEMPSFPAELLTATATVACGTSVICMGKAAFSWLSSQELQQHLRRVRQAQRSRRIIRDRLEGAIDRWLDQAMDMHLQMATDLAPSSS